MYTITETQKQLKKELSCLPTDKSKFIMALVERAIREAWYTGYEDGQADAELTAFLASKK